MPRPRQQNDLARQAGFESYLALMEGCTPVSTSDGSRWYVCPVGQRWGVWNDADLQLIDGFPSVTTAQDYARARSGTATAAERAANATEIDPLAAGAEMKPPLP